MNFIWDDNKKKSNISDDAFEDLILNSKTDLVQDDKDFIFTSFNAKMYNYVVEYVFNKSIKVLQDAVFAVGEEIVVNVTHWIDRTFISKFFDVFVLRLSCDLGLITKEEKVIILHIIELLQKRKDNYENCDQIDKERVKFLIAGLFEAILTKDFSKHIESMDKMVEVLTTEELTTESESYKEILNLTNKHKNLLARVMFAMLKTLGTQDLKKYKVLSQNVINLFPKLWENTSLNDKKFIAYYLKASPEDSIIRKTFHSLEGNIELESFNTDLNTVTQILKNCQDVLSCHYSINNHNEETVALLKLSEIDNYPNFFLRSVITPCLVTYLGNNNGYLSDSRALAEQIFEKLDSEQWLFYFNNFFEKDDFIHTNLMIVEGCLKDWCLLIKKLALNENEIHGNETIKGLLIASRKQDFEKVKKLASELYYN